MAPELMFVKDIADMAKDLGPYGVIGFLIFLLKLQKEAHDKKEDTWIKAAAERETAWTVKLEEYAKGSRSDLTQMIDVSTRSNTAWQTATSTLEKLSGVIQGARDLLVVMPGMLDRNLDHIDKIGSAASLAAEKAGIAAQAAAQAVERTELSRSPAPDRKGRA